MKIYDRLYKEIKTQFFITAIIMSRLVKLKTK